MLQIRPAQMKAFEEAALRRFENDMAAHSRQFAPNFCEALGETQLRVALRQAISRAAGYGFTAQAPLRLFIEMVLLFGSAFDTDPQYPWAAEILHATDDQLQRCERLSAKTRDYQKKASGPDAATIRKVLEDLSALAQKPLMLPAGGFAPAMLRELDRIFPQKVACIGQPACAALVEEGAAEAKKYRLPAAHGEALLVVLMCALGHGCTDDPLYPWIAQTLKDDKVVQPAARFERLQQQAVAWFQQMGVK